MLPEALKLINKALEQEPENGAYVDSLGWVYFKQGRIKEAIEQLERAKTFLKTPSFMNILATRILR